MEHIKFPSLKDYLAVKKNGGHKGFIIDIDGTLKIGACMVPKASDAISYLKDNGYPYLLATNDAGCSLPSKADSLRRMGIPVGVQDIFCCAESIKQFVALHHLGGKKFFVLGRLGDPCYATEAGLLVERDPDMAHLCSGIIVSELGYNWEPAINAAANLLIRCPETIFIAPNPDSHWRAHTGDGISIGAGAIVDLIKQVVKRNGITVNPFFLGKPNPSFFCNALRKMNRLSGTKVKKHEILVIGDSLTSDIRGAHLSKMTSALVLTGATSLKSLQSIHNKNLIPHVILEHI